MGQDYAKYLKIAGNVHLAYYVAAADKLGIKYEIVKRSLIAYFETNGKHWYIINTATPINPVTGTTVSRRKNLAYLALKRKGIPVAAQEEIKDSSEAIDFFEKYNQIVLKPTNNLGGKGITILPDETEEVLAAYQLAEASDLSKSSTKVLAEEFIDGTDYRLLTLGDRVIGAVRRKPPVVIGDGETSIHTLINDYNHERKANTMKPIPIDEQVHKKLAVQGYTLTSIPEAGAEVPLRFNSNLSTGGTTEECLDEIAPYYLELAVQATKAVGLKLAGVDLIAADVSNPDAPHVINELNWNPGLRVHYKVDKGEVKPVAEDIQKYIVDNYDL